MSLKINFQKSELFCFGATKDKSEVYAELFGCKQGKIPFGYLGIPMHYRKNGNKDRMFIEERFQKKLGNKKGKMLLFDGRLVLISSL